MNDSVGGRRTLHRGALRVMLASVVVSALMGCYALLREDWGETEERLLLSTLSVFGTSMITLACGVAWERGRLDGPALDPGRGETGVRFCPNCAAALEPPGAAACETCGGTFQVRVTAPPPTWH